MEIGAETVSQDEIDARDPMVGSSEEDADAVYDGGRNWTADATEVLVRAWRKVSWEGRAPDEKMTHVIQRIFVEYQRRVPSTRRNAKAVEDKVNCLSQAYRFITDFNAHRVPGSAGRPSWDRIPLRERKEIRRANRIRVPDLDSKVFEVMSSFLGDKPGARPITSNATVNRTAPATKTGAKRNRDNGRGTEDISAHSFRALPRVAPTEVVVPRLMPLLSTGALSHLPATTSPAQDTQGSATTKPRGVLELLDCLSKTYAIRAQLRTAMNDVDAHGQPDPFLQQSIELVEAGLRVVEREYADAMGIACPHNTAGAGMT